MDNIVKRIDAAVEGSPGSSHRWHLGASVIGQDCPRKIWYSFRWAKKEPFSGRMLRLFDRGHREEAKFVEILLGIGITLWDQDPATGWQFVLSRFGGHLGGSLDGVGRGLPEIGGSTPFLTEFKTHNDKSFKHLNANGVQVSKLQHYVQMQIYMEAYSLEWGLYLAVNKNDDQLYAELIPLDTAVAEHYHKRAESIIFSDTPPPRINNSPGWWQCRFCPFRQICHGSEIPEINHRTCAHITPERDGTWYCRKCERSFTKDDRGEMEQPCPGHLFNPCLLNGVDSIEGGSVEENWVDVKRGGKVVRLGPQYLSSQELYGNGWQE